MSGTLWKKYLLWFANDHKEFRLPEVQAILSLYKIAFKWTEEPSADPFLILEVPSEECVRKIASRCVGLRRCLELWGRGKTEEELHANVKEVPQELMQPYCDPKYSFKINVETFCGRQSQSEKVKKIEKFSYLPLPGPVNLKNPDVTFYLIEYYGLDSNHIPEKPYDLFFGRWVAEGQRDIITKLSLKTRKFIGNTSMDPQLSLLMANQAQVKNGDIVLDPFVGTGSLLVAAAYFGGFVLGCDINYLMLHGKSRPSRIQVKEREKDEGVRKNLEQYGLESKFLDVIVADASLPLWRSSMKLDAIITDPPYGIREATERIGSLRSYQVSEEHLPTHIPAKVEYGLTSIYQDLFKFSAQHLQIGGRLVCWLPVVRPEYKEEELPSYPGFQLIANSEQVLSTYTSRRLLTYEKMSNPEGFCEAGSSLIADFRAKLYLYGEENRRQRLMKKERKTRNKENYFGQLEKKNC